LLGINNRSIFRAEFESAKSEVEVRDINVSNGIVPLGEFKTNASKIIRDIAGSDEPLVITQNGRPAAVLMSPSAFQELRERQEFLQAVAEGVADSEAGRVVDHKKTRRWLESWGTDREKDAPK
jgi:prevent-host-death family protein